MVKLFGTFFNLSMSNLSPSDFKLTKSFVLAKFDVSIPLAFLNLRLLHKQANLIELSDFILKILALENFYSFVLFIFYLTSY